MRFSVRNKLMLGFGATYVIGAITVDDVETLISEGVETMRYAWLDSEATAIEEVFFHCAKAFLRSEAWKPEAWNPTAVPSVAQLVKLMDADADIDELRKLPDWAREKARYRALALRQLTKLGLPAEYGIDPTGAGRALGLDRVAQDETDVEPLPGGYRGRLPGEDRDPLAHEAERGRGGSPGT